MAVSVLIASEENVSFSILEVAAVVIPPPTYPAVPELAIPLVRALVATESVAESVETESVEKATLVIAELADPTEPPAI